MLIVEFNGGLGNQMFQYALYLQLKKCGKNVKLDNISRYGGQAYRPFSLEVFDIEKNYAVQDEIDQYRDEKGGICNRVRRKIFGSRDKIFNELDERYLGEVFEKNEGIVSGFWQSSEYFKGVSGKIRDLYNPQRKLEGMNQEWLKKIKNTISVSVHIRRGDYLASNVSKVFGGICTLEYYKKAFSYFRTKYIQPQFYIFTNDPQWVKENYTEKDCVVVDCNGEAEGYIDLYLMSFCQHHIIANSSFSWWGAWLGQNSAKEIVAPRKWNNIEEDNVKIYCKGWIQI